MLTAGSAYRCYATPADLEAMRDAQRARGEKTLYDGRWRPEPGKTLPPIPEGVPPVIRFRNPPDGAVSWDDMVKGPITISNHEIDDLVIVRADGIPTYNFAVVVDDWDMAHQPRLSRRRARQQHAMADQHLHGARRAPAGVRARADHPRRRRSQALEAARRGQRHVVRGGRLPARGDAQLPRSARLEPRRRGALLARAAGRLVRWQSSVEESGAMGSGQARLGQRALPEGAGRRTDARAGAGPAGASRHRGAATTRPCCAPAPSSRSAAAPVPSSPAGWRCSMRDVAPSARGPGAARRRRRASGTRLAARASWRRSPGTRRRSPPPIKETLAEHGLKMNVLAPAVRVVVCGRAQTPSLDAVLEVFDASVFERRHGGDSRRRSPDARLAGYNLGLRSRRRPSMKGTPFALTGSVSTGV